MNKQKTYFSVTKPASIWKRTVKADFGKLFKSLTKSIINIKLGNAPGFGDNLVDIYDAIRLKEHSIGDIAWILIDQALTNATISLVKDGINQFKINPDVDVDELCTELELKWKDNEESINSVFFSNPKQLQILKKYRNFLNEWFLLCGLEKNQAIAFVNRFDSFFVYALRDEWVTKPQRYSCLREALESPFTDVAEREDEWARYLASLEIQVDKSMMGEPFGLRQVYIPLRAYYTKKDKSKSDPHDSVPENKKPRIIVDLKEEISKWLAANKKPDAIRIISGGPGSGKSSFLKMLASDISESRSQRVIYIPLHLLDVNKDLGKAINDYFSDTNLLTHNPIEAASADQKLLLILDGLDELAMSQKDTVEIAHDFVLNLCWNIERYNSSQVCVQAILAGRTVNIQSIEARFFREQGQVIHVLPYIISEETKKLSTNVSEKRLAFDQRKEWWIKYGKAKGIHYTGLPKELDRNDLSDLTTQPLFNYLLALSYELGKIDFSDTLNLNTIYYNLLEAVFDRDYDRGTSKSIDGLKFSGFARILEEISLAAWHGAGRTATISEIENYCSSSALKKHFKMFSSDAKQGVGRLLTAFYFRQHTDRDSDHTFEFTHKSFGEYLVARRLVRGIQKIDVEIRRNEEDAEDGWGNKDALLHWLKLTRIVPIDTYLFKFLHREIQMASTERVRKWQIIFSSMISHMLRKGFPFQNLQRESQLLEVQHARNAGEALLVVLSICAEKTDETSIIDWPNNTAAGSWIKQLQGQRSDSTNTLAMSNLSRLNLEKQILYSADLYCANLEKTELCEAYLDGANLIVAYLRRADLRGADLYRADLNGTNLSGANLSG
ncbi:pentapeptide repeat-containing protein, partial [bacterium]|nr:pentapeptide repeat-containing protein [bacterium]